MCSEVSNLKGQSVVCLEYSKKISLILKYGELPYVGGGKKGRLQKLD